MSPKVGRALAAAFPDSETRGLLHALLLAPFFRCEPVFYPLLTPGPLTHSNQLQAYPSEIHISLAAIAVWMRSIRPSALHRAAHLTFFDRST